MSPFDWLSDPTQYQTEGLNKGTFSALHIHQYRLDQSDHRLEFRVDFSLQISRRSWSGHPLAKETLSAAMAIQPKLSVTIPHEVQSCELLNLVCQD